MENSKGLVVAGHFTQLTVPTTMLGEAEQEKTAKPMQKRKRVPSEFTAPATVLVWQNTDALHSYNQTRRRSSILAAKAYQKSNSASSFIIGDPSSKTTAPSQSFGQTSQHASVRLSTVYQKSQSASSFINARHSSTTPMLPDQLQQLLAVAIISLKWDEVEKVRLLMMEKMNKVEGLTTRECDKAVCKLAQNEELMVIFYKVDKERQLGWVKNILGDTA
ncbi:hypothetical protein L1987_22532 [Smallanthus sonchifolius]|uniref:Uncharacterized protein n=1 Tax=Smallanthus sonchifolius TaxID=185202 RepID=A0ACB9IGL7_9ASTR|nr:hypothetical protein L1987_22532 [Smallanthus sonchifolius]